MAGNHLCVTDHIGNLFSKHPLLTKPPPKGFADISSVSVSNSFAI